MWPPSVNHYWKNAGYGRVIISDAGRNFRNIVSVQCSNARRSGAIPERPLTGRLKVSLVCHPPDRRCRDLDNLGKALLDACTKARVWKDDEQIDELRYVRSDVVKGGRVEVQIEEVSP